MKKYLLSYLTSTDFDNIYDREERIGRIFVEEESVRRGVIFELVLMMGMLLLSQGILVVVGEVLVVVREVLVVLRVVNVVLREVLVEVVFRMMVVFEEMVVHVGGEHCL